MLNPSEDFLDAFTTEDDGSVTLFLLRPGQTPLSWVGHVDGAALHEGVQRWQTARTTWLGSVTSTNSVIVARRNALMATAAADEQLVLAELSYLVFAPVLAQLDEKVTTLIVSPDGLLHRLPIAAVTLPGEDGQPQPLIDRLDLQLVPTASSLAILRGPHGPRVSWPAELLAAAPFAIEHEDDGTRSVTSQTETTRDDDRTFAGVFHDLVRRV